MLFGSSYMLPKDASEDERLDAQHRLEKLVVGALYLAPILDPRHILDVGCGTGLWCQEMAALYPQATIWGLDFDLKRVNRKSRRSNLRWREADALEHLPFLDNAFDYVHLRFAGSWVPRAKWPTLMREMVRVTKPAGLIGMAEGRAPESDDPAYMLLSGALVTMCHQRGLDVEIVAHLADHARGAGLISVEEHSFTAGETSTTPERRALEQRLLYETTLAGFQHLAPIMRKQLDDRAYARYMKALAQVEQHPPHITRRDVIVFGQKPMAW